jgi:hypothetical protein
MLRAMRAAVICIVLLAGCKDPEVEQLTKFKVELCACKQASCAEQVLARVPPGEPSSSRRAQAIAREMMTCVAELYAAERPVTDLDAPAPEAPAPAPAPPP